MFQGFLERHRGIPSRFCWGNSVNKRDWHAYLPINLNDQKKELSISLMLIKEILIYLYSIKIKKRFNFFEHIKRDFSRSLLSKKRPNLKKNLVPLKKDLVPLKKGLVL